MREIKFRAWDKKEKRMCSRVISIALSDDDLPSITTLYVSPTETSLKGNSTDFILLQYTSLKDSKGIEIYEGDIINYDNKSFHNGLNGVVKWSGSGFYISDYIPLFALVEKFNTDIEIIGNIYENPELLKK